MLKGMLAAFGALAAVSVAAVFAPLPAAAQTGGDLTSTATAAGTATATPAPMATSTMATSTVATFALKPHIGNLQPRALTRLGNKWHVGGSNGAGYVYVFSDAGTYERRIKARGTLSSGVSMSGNIQGLASDGTNLIAVSTPSSGQPRVYTWAPQANETALPLASIASLTTPVGGGTYAAKGIAYDGTNAWMAVEWTPTGKNAKKRYALLKLNDTGIDAIYRMSRTVDSLAYRNGYLYGLTVNSITGKRDTLRVKIGAGSTLAPYTSAALLGLGDPPMNYSWKAAKKAVGIRGGLVFRNGVAYGFNEDQDEVRQGRRPSPETLFTFSPYLPSPNMQPRALTRLGSKWYVGGIHNDLWIGVFSDAGVFEGLNRPPEPLSVLRGLTNDGTNLIAVTGGSPRVLRWAPTIPDSSDKSSLNWSQSLPAPPGGGRYVGHGAAYDGTHIWVAADWTPTGKNAKRKYALLKYNPALSSPLVGTYPTNMRVDSLTYKNGYLYGLSRSARDTPDVDLMLIRVGWLGSSMNYWRAARRSVEIRSGLAFRNGTAYGFNEDQDEVRAERRPSPEMLFRFRPHFAHPRMAPRALARLGGKWHVAGHSGDGWVGIFSNAGAFERLIRPPNGSIRGLTAAGTDLVAVTGGAANLHRWTPQANSSTAASPNWSQALPAPPGGGRYVGHGAAYDGTHIWVAADWTPTGKNAKRKYALLKYNPALSSPLAATYLTNVQVDSLTYKDGYLYGLSRSARDNPDVDLARISPTSLSTSATNNWTVVRRSVEIRHGLAFRNGTAYGFNAAQDEVRAARRTSVTTPTTPTTPANPASPAS